MTRVSHSMIYNNSMYNMNKAMSDLMTSNMESSSQKRVNKPSDDPYGTGMILNSRSTLSRISQYKGNIGMAKGWLSTAESALDLVDDQLVLLKEKLLKGADGGTTEKDRAILATEARQIMEQIISLSNAKFGGRYVFAGHKTDSPAFGAGMGVTARDNALDGVTFEVEGSNKTTAIVQFLEDGDAATTSLQYRYSLDGGKTWIDKDGSGNPLKSTPYAAGTAGTPGVPGTADVPSVVDCGGVKVKMWPDSSGHINVKKVDISNKHENANGTWLYLRPTAVYNGDTNDAQASLLYPSAGTIASITGVKGDFSKDIAVRVNGFDPATGDLMYSYSMDNGGQWISDKAKNTASPPQFTGDISLPGGILSLKDAQAGDQFIVKPHRADMELNISDDSTLVINNVGLDILGGNFAPGFTRDGAQPQGGRGAATNLFEVLGEAVAYLETNNQQGCQEALDKLKTAQEHVVTQRTKIGSLVNRADSALEQMTVLEFDETDRMSSVEDVDVMELMTRLAKQQLAYNSVLKSSSMIMQMSLMNFL